MDSENPSPLQTTDPGSVGSLSGQAAPEGAAPRPAVCDKQLNFRLPAGERARLDRVADLFGYTVGEIARAAIADFCARCETPAGRREVVQRTAALLR